MGILGMIACPITGLAAVVTGIISIVRASREPIRYGGRGMAIAGLVCGAVGAFCIGPMLLAIFLPSLSRARELSRRLVCATHMQSIGTAMLIYESDYPNQGLPTLQRLVELDMISAKEILCPIVRSGQPNYVLVAAPDRASSDVVAVYEPKTNHLGEGGNVLFADGKVTFAKAPAFDDMIRKVGASAVPNQGGP